MRTRLKAFVTFLCAATVGACGTTSGGGGGSGAIYCGIGGTCPAGFACNANNFCIPGSADATVSDTVSKSDAGSADSSNGVDIKGEDIKQASDVQVDTFTPDVTVQDVQTGGQTVSAIEQGEASVTCASPSASVDTAAGVTLEPVVVTSPPTKLKGSGTTYFTTFFVEPVSGAATDGSWAGIQVIVNADPFTVSEGDVLTVTGTVKEFYCMTEIVAAASDVVVTGTATEPAPHTVLVSTFADSSAEAYEGDLIKVTNVQVQDPNPISTDGKTHGECAINHNGGAATVNFAPPQGSSYLTTGTNGTATTFTAGQAFTSITGNLQWSFGHWVIRARSDADIVLK